ncbi:MAG: hypothetical protein P4L82_14045 [Ancalomicrobiaceae bacterium]|nr:hypothetical protein [Ancalomicrobiaceae bacterium]
MQMHSYKENRDMLDVRVLVLGAMALMIAIAGSSNSSAPARLQQVAQRPDAAILQMLLLTARCPPVDPLVTNCSPDITGSIRPKSD